MLAPILRLLAIYCVVGLLVFGFFKRDAIMGMFANGDAPAETAETPNQPVIQPPTSPAAQPASPVYAPVAAEAAAVTQSEPAQPVAAIAKPDYETEINQARAAYWANDRAKAIATYSDLLAHYPNDEAANGELGNIYFMNGKRDLAATYYERAANAAIKDGHRSTAQMLIGVLRSINPAAASRLMNAGSGQ